LTTTAADPGAAVGAAVVDVDDAGTAAGGEGGGGEDNGWARDTVAPMTSRAVVTNDDHEQGRAHMNEP
jgi:hypothetical protein